MEKNNPLTCNKVYLTSKRRFLTDTFRAQAIKSVQDSPSVIRSDMVSASQNNSFVLKDGDTCDKFNTEHSCNQKYVKEVNSQFDCEIMPDVMNQKNYPIDQSINNIIMQGKPFANLSCKQNPSRVNLNNNTTNETIHDDSKVVGNMSMIKESGCSQVRLGKPIIIAAANTNKHIKLEHRREKICKNINIPKVGGKLKKGVTKTILVNDNNNDKTTLQNKSEHKMSQLPPSSLQVGHSSTDIGKSLKDRLKSFAKMDIEFYDIINKMDEANDKRNLIPEIFPQTNSEQFDQKDNTSGNVSTTDNKCIINIQNVDRNKTEHVPQQVKSVGLFPSSADKQNLNNELNLDRSVVNSVNRENSMLSSAITKKTISNVIPEKRLIESSGKANDRKNIGYDNTPMLNNKMIVSGISFKEKPKYVEECLHEDKHINDDWNNERGGSNNDICDSDVSSQSISSLFPVNETRDIREAIKIMHMSADISNEDIIHISASRMPLEEKIFRSAARKNAKQHTLQGRPDANTVHRFCTSYPEVELDLRSKVVSRYSHAPSQYAVLKPKGIKQLGVSKFEVSDTATNTSTADSSNLTLIDNLKEVDLPVGEKDRRHSEIAIKIMKELKEGEDVSNKKLMKLQYLIDQIIEPEHCFSPGIVGQKIEMKNDESRYFQTPYPPKFNMTPQVVTNTLAPQYLSVLETDKNILEENIEEEIDMCIEADVTYEKMSDDEKMYMERIVNRKHNTAMGILQYGNHTDSDDSENEPTKEDRFVSLLDMRRKYKKSRPNSAFSFTDINNGKRAFERSLSQPNLIVRKHVENPLSSDYNSIMVETLEQCAQLKSIKDDVPLFDASQSDRTRTVDGELILRTEEVLYRDVENLTKSKSMVELSNYPAYHSETLQNAYSENDLTKLNEEVIKRHAYVNIEMNIWLKEEFWYKWFDEIFPPNDYEEMSLSMGGLTSSSISDGLTCNLETLPKNDCHANDLIQIEIDFLSVKISNMSSSSGLLGFHLCRRGACYRKVGELKKALDDLNRAIEVEPKLTDAYWHRHLVFLIQDNTRKALEDLNRITICNYNHTGAYRSRAEIYKQKGESTLAISSYNHAIASDPTNPELYYARAELLEERGELLLAVDDYRSANLYEPENTSAIKRIGMYHFDHGLWMIAVNDFTELLRKQSKNAEAYMFRGRAWANLGKYPEAISDLSVSITLQPNYFLPLYYRGCYLRKCMPKQALQDFSVSLLLDSTIANVNSFLHRGILYVEIKRYDQATCDFQQAVRLNPRLSAAHVNLGVIEMKHNHNIHLAIKRFNVALRMDPTYIRAVICRAEASEKVNDINAAILDYTRAIHMKPDSTDLRMTRGRLLLKKNQLDLASFHIRQCAVMNDGKNASTTQKAAVETFLKNYTNAINVLELAVKSNPVVNLFELLGRTRMKAKQFGDAINDFNCALKVIKPWDLLLSWPKESANIFFLIGMCHMELNEYKSALDSFNISLKTNSTFAEGYFNRGLVKMKLGISKGVHDFNKALSYRPEYYQAYLGRAAYYGKSKRYAKAIMNCNEAIKIEKESIRAFLYRGAIKFNIKSYALAIKDLSQAIEMDCTCSLAYFNRAVCFHEKKYYFHALKDYSIVLMGDNNLKMKALLNRGLLYFQIGDMENAIQDFVLALEDDPENTKIHHTLGLCYHRLGHLQKSIQSYTNALTSDPFFSGALLGRGNVLMDYNHKLGNLLGKRDYIRAVHLNPLCMEARVNLAYSLQMQGYFKKAWNLFTRTIEIDPQYKAALEGRALVNLQMSNTFGAFVDMNSAINIRKTAESLTLRGVVNQFLGDRMSAMNDYQSAKNLDPTYSLAYYNAANLYFLHRQLSQAIFYYTKAIDWNPNDGAAFLNRAVAKSISKDYQGAVDDFAAVEKLSPHWNHIYFNRGYLHYINERFELAEEDYTRSLILQANDALTYKKRADARGKGGKKELSLKDYQRSIHLQVNSQTQ